MNNNYTKIIFFILELFNLLDTILYFFEIVKLIMNNKYTKIFFILELVNLLDTIIFFLFKYYKLKLFLFLYFLKHKQLCIINYLMIIINIILIILII